MQKLVNAIFNLASCFVFFCGGCLPLYAESNEQKTFAHLQDGLDQYVKASPYVKDGVNSGETIPQLPAPPAVSLPSLASSQAAPMSLNWRSRALALANEYPLKKNSLAWTLPVAYKKGQKILKQALIQNGLNLISEYDDSGQFLVALPEPNKTGDIIIISQPLSDSRTLFRMHKYADDLAYNERVNSLPETMKNLLDNTGLWQ